MSNRTSYVPATSLLAQSLSPLTSNRSGLRTNHTLEDHV